MGFMIIKNNGFVNVGISHDAEFAVESIKQWWKNIGKREIIPKQRIIVICSR